MIFVYLASFIKKLNQTLYSTAQFFLKKQPFILKIRVGLSTEKVLKTHFVFIDQSINVRNR